MIRLAIVLLLLCSAANAERMVEIGPSQVASNMSAGGILTLTERWNDSFDFTIGYVSEQKVTFCDRKDCTWTLRPQIMAGVEMVTDVPWIENLKFSVGPYWFQNPDRVATTNFRMGMSLEYRISEHFGLRARHWSNGGSGKDMCERIDYEDPTSYEVCNNWNTGQDSWLRLVIYW